MALCHRAVIPSNEELARFVNLATFLTEPPVPIPHAPTSLARPLPNRPVAGVVAVPVGTGVGDRSHCSAGLLARRVGADGMARGAGAKLHAV